MALESIDKNDIANNFTSQGGHIIPVKFRSKIPDVPDFTPYLEGKKVWKDPISKEQNLGLICGLGNVFVIDLEKIHPDDYWKKTPQPRHIPCEVDFLNKIIPNCINATFTTRTGSENFHIIGKAERLPDKTSKLVYEKDRDNIYQIDFKVTGQCVEAGSIHENGNPYEMISNVRTIKTFGIKDILKRFEEIGFRSTTKKIDAENDFKKWSKEELLKGNWVRGERRRKMKSLYCKLRREKKSIEEATREVNSILDTLEDKLDNSEIEINLVDAERFFQNEVLPKWGYVDNPIYEIEKLNNIDNPIYASKKIRTQAIVASNPISYSVPKVIHAECKISDSHECMKSRNVTFTLEHSAKFVDAADNIRHNMLESYFSSVFSAKCEKQYDVTQSRTIRRIRLRPLVQSLIQKEQKFFDDEGNDWAPYDVYMEYDDMQKLQAGQKITIEGTVTHDSKNSKITLLIDKIEKLDDASPNHEQIQELMKFFDDKKPQDVLDWIVLEFQKYSKIVRRHDVIVTELLTPFSALYFQFQGKLEPAWLKNNVIGDSTVGKTASARNILKLIKKGQMMSGELASIAGLTGAAVQTSSGNWICDFGVLPMNDRGLLVIDGAHALGAEEKAKVAETERSGELEIMKAAKLSTYARTRLLRIENPLDEDRHTTVTMGNFLYPVQALQYNYQTQSIARIDLACFVEDDVSPEERNARITEPHDQRLETLSEIVKIVWDKKYTVEFTEDAIETILKKATYLENKFKFDEIPLVTNDEKTKLAKISASVAALCCNFKNHDPITYTVVVEPKHVEYAADFKDSVYVKAGLDVLAQQNRSGDANIEELWQIVHDLSSKTGIDDYETLVNVLKWMAEKQHFKREELQEEFDFSRDKQAQPILGYLKNENLIKRLRNHYSITKKGVKIVKFVFDFSSSRASRPTKSDTPPNDDNVLRGVSVLVELERLDRLKIKTYVCTTCNTTWKNTTDELRKISAAHTQGHNIREAFTQ